jgi:steroid delta-isomerase-like uncharacterized protein
MSIAENEKIARLWFEILWSRPDPGSVVEEIVHPDYQPDKSLFAKGGPRQVREEIKQGLRSFPDSTSEIIDMCATEDRVWVRYKFRGTHKGEFLGFPATGKTVEIEGVTILYIKDHKVIDTWTSLPLFDMLTILGLAPPVFALKDFLRWPPK